MNIALLNHFSAETITALNNMRYQTQETPENCHAILVRSKSLHETAFEPDLLAVARAGAGVNNLPIDRLSEQGVAVFNAPGANANAVAEMALSALLMQLRQLSPALSFCQALDSSNASDMSAYVEANKSQFQGQELASCHLGIIGLGAIGVLLANKAVALGMTVSGYDPNISIENAWRLSADVQQKDRLEALAADCDCLSIHVPYLLATHHLIDEALISKLPANSFVLNFSRAEVVDEDALIRALDQSQLSGYISDFPRPELLHHPKVICLPHLGASTLEAQRNASEQVLQTLDAFLKRGEIRHSVNLPNMNAGAIPKHSVRLVIVHKNTVGMIAKITDCIEALNINIVEMNNRSRQEIAVTLLDLSGPCSLALLDCLRDVPDTFSVRYCPNP
jgi:D-3-phosphoglycerate dehydrogenase